jgi:hypothetical protein
MHLLIDGACTLRFFGSFGHGQPVEERVETDPDMRARSGLAPGRAPETGSSLLCRVIASTHALSPIGDDEVKTRCRSAVDFLRQRTCRDGNLAETTKEETSMYARVARFEGGDPSLIDEQVAEMKEQMAAARTGNLPADAPEQVRTLMDTVSRFLELVDRTSGASLGIAFCETEEDVQRAHATLNEMSPPEGGPKRTSVDIFEVVLDENFR